MFSLNKPRLLLIVVSMFLFSSLLFAQVNSRTSGDGKANTGNGMIVGKDGAAFRLSPRGEIRLTIPDWLLPRIKTNPTKYKLKITVSKMDQKFLETKLDGNKKTNLSFTLTVKHGSKELDKSFSKEMSKANIAQKANEVFIQFYFPLTNGDDSNIQLNSIYAGEPVPGAEIYVELEPDDEP